MQFLTIFMNIRNFQFSFLIYNINDWNIICAPQIPSPSYSQG
jgi:hypothetical protein